jgi:predicted transcriptional regulator
VESKQAGTETSVRVPAQVYLDPGQWARFNAVARAQNRSRSAHIRELIRREITAFEADDDIEQAA